MKRSHKTYSQKEDNCLSSGNEEAVELELLENLNSENLLSNQNVIKLGVKLLKEFFKIVNGEKKIPLQRITKIKKQKSHHLSTKNVKKPRTTKFKT